MMQQHNNVFKQLSLVAMTQLRVRWPWRRLFLLIITFTIVLVGLACVFGGSTTRSVADRVVFLTRLPTLTRTPLPTLTPTANPTAAVMTLPIEAEATVAASLASPTTAAVLPDETVTAPATVAANAPATSTQSPPAGIVIVPARVTPNPEVAPAEFPPTHLPIATEPPPPTSTSTATATAAPSPSPTSAENPTATPLSEG